MDATRIVLVRHGAVHADWRGRVYGALDVPLSGEGKAEAELVARRLERANFDAVISSGLERTEYGAALLRASRALPRIDDRELRELERGEWAGAEVSDLERHQTNAWAAWFASPASLRPPGGESLADLFARVRPRVDHWAHAQPRATIALVTHGWVVRVLLCFTLRAPLDFAPRIDIRTGDIAVLRWPLHPSAHPILDAFALDGELPQFSE